MIPQSTACLRSKLEKAAKIQVTTLAGAAAARAALLKRDQLEAEAALIPRTRQLAVPSRSFELAEDRSHEPSSGDFLIWDRRNLLGPVILQVQKLLHPEDTLTD